MHLRISEIREGLVPLALRREGPRTFMQLADLMDVTRPCAWAVVNKLAQDLLVDIRKKGVGMLSEIGVCNEGEALAAAPLPLRPRVTYSLRGLCTFRFRSTSCSNRSVIR